MKHRDKFYREASRGVDLIKALEGERKAALSAVYDTISDIIWNHAVPVFGILNEKTQNALRNRYNLFKQLDPKRAAFSSAVVFGVFGYYLTELYGDGSLNIWHMYPHREFGQVIDRPVSYNILGSESTEMSAYTLIVDSSLRAYYALVKGKALGLFGGIAKFIGSAYNFGYRLVAKDLNLKGVDQTIGDVKEMHEIEEAVVEEYIKRTDLESRLELEGLRRHKKTIAAKTIKLSE